MRISKKEKIIDLNEKDDGTQIILSHKSGEKISLLIKYHPSRVFGVIFFKDPEEYTDLEDLDVYIEREYQGSGEDIAIWKPL